MDWTAEAIDQLRAYWDEGLSTAEIGRRMGISKNAVVGKAHRLNLPARPSPIRRDVAPHLQPQPAPTRPQQAPVAPRAPAPPQRRLEERPPVAATMRPAAAPAAVVRPFPRAASRSCCWPIGEPGTSGFRFCADVATPGKPYCTPHAALAYVKVRDRREDAA